MSEENEEMYDLLAFLVSSASRLNGEPASYGPLRLIEGAKRLCQILVKSDDEKASEIQELIDIIEEGKLKNMTDADSFQSMLDVATEKLVDIL